MRISGIGYSPFIYNTNRVSANSLKPIAGISDDVSKSRVNFNGLVEDENVTINPLKRGESSNFADILTSQFAIGMANRDRLGLNETSLTQNTPDDMPSFSAEDASSYLINRAINAYS